MENLMNILPSNVTNALGWTLLNSLWQATVLLILFNIYIHFAKNTDKKYNAGLVILMAQLIISAINFAIIYEPQVLIKTGIGNSAINFAIGEITNENINNVPTYFSLIYWLANKLNMIVGLWVIGLCYFLIRFCYNLWQVNTLKTKGVTTPNTEILAIFEKILVIVKNSKPVKLLESSQINGPVLIGHFKTVLLMPIGLCSQLTQPEIEAIFAHELAHLRRNDFFVNLLQSVVDIFYFFNPAMQYLSYQIRDERENCCDEFAAEIGGGKLPIAKALVSLEAYRQDISLAMAFGRKSSSLKSRVQKLLGIGPDKVNYNFGLISILILILGGILYLNSQNLFAQNKSDSDLDSNSLIIVSENYLFPMTVTKGNKKLSIKREKEKLFLNGKEVEMPLVDNEKLDFHFKEIEKLKKEKISDNFISVSFGNGNENENENMEFYYLNKDLEGPKEINEILEIAEQTKKWQTDIDSSKIKNQNDLISIKEKIKNNKIKIEELNSRLEAKQNAEIAKLKLEKIKTISDYRKIQQEIKFHENEMKKLLPNEVLVAFKDIAGYEMFKSVTPPPPPPLAPPAPPTPPAPPALLVPSVPPKR
jgi:bla regulator protein blaR1